MTDKQTVLDFFSADDEAQAQRHIYKFTSCGAWISFKDWGVIIGSIVEGCDFGTMSYPLRYADNFTDSDIQARTNAVEKEADAIWEWANILKDVNGRRHCNGKTDAERGMDCPDVNVDFQQFEQGERSS